MPRKNWVIFENTHPAIIDQDTYDIVQRLIQTKRRPTDMGEMNIFSGLVYCSDCGQRMYLCRCATTKQKEYFNCSTYRKKKKKLCTSHQITVEAIEHIVLNDLKRVFECIKTNEQEFLNAIRFNVSKESRKTILLKTQELEEAEKRIKMLDRIIQNLYEDKVNGNLTAERFAKMTQIYEEEQTSLTEKASALRQELMTIKEELDNVNRFMRTIRKYGDINELTPDLVRNFIEKVVVHQAEKTDGKRKQVVEIFYNGVGAIPQVFLKEKGSGTALCRTTSHKRKISIEHTLMMCFFFIINL